MKIQAEVSLYPLEVADVAPPIFLFVERLERPGLTIEIGPLSTRLTGEAELVFLALREAFTEAAGTQKCVLVTKMLGVPTDGVARRMA